MPARQTAPIVRLSGPAPPEPERTPGVGLSVDTSPPPGVPLGNPARERNRIERLIIQREVVARDRVYTCILLPFPGRGAKTGGGGKQLVGRDLAGPKRFCCLLQRPLP